MTDPIKALVYEALDNAKENGYDDFLVGSAEQIAGDMIEYCQQLEDTSPALIIPHVLTWQSASV